MFRLDQIGRRIQSAALDAPDYCNSTTWKLGHSGNYGIWRHETSHVWLHTEVLSHKTMHLLNSATGDGTSALAGQT